jgi:hypothetical protein
MGDFILIMGLRSGTVACPCNGCFTVMQYMPAGEESRLGFKDYWKNDFPARPPAGRVCLETTKAVFVTGLYFALTKGISLL